MQRAWKIGVFPDEVWIVPSFASALPTGAIEIFPENAAFHVDAWFPNDGLGRARLAEIVEAIAGPWLPSPRGFSSELRDMVREALRRGELKAYSLQPKLVGGVVAVAEEAPRPQQQPAAEKKTFVIVELVDDSDPPKPVPFKKYRIELPDHSVREGMLDAAGQARVVGIDPGACKVSFPGLHADDWGPA